MKPEQSKKAVFDVSSESEVESPGPLKARFSNNMGAQTRQNVPYLPSFLRTKHSIAVFPIQKPGKSQYDASHEEHGEFHPGKKDQNKISPMNSIGEENIICSLCKRKFRDSNHLFEHEKRSRRHHYNLRDQSQVNP